MTTDIPSVGQKPNRFSKKGNAKNIGSVGTTYQKVYQTGLINEIQENDRVQFTLEKGKKGMNAVNVERI